MLLTMRWAAAIPLGLWMSACGSVPAAFGQVTSSGEVIVGERIIHQSYPVYEVIPTSPVVTPSSPPRVIDVQPAPAVSVPGSPSPQRATAQPPVVEHRVESPVVTQSSRPAPPKRDTPVENRKRKPMDKPVMQLVQEPKPEPAADDESDPNDCFQPGSDSWKRLVELIRENAKLQAAVEKADEIRELHLEMREQRIGEIERECQRLRGQIAEMENAQRLQETERRMAAAREEAANRMREQAERRRVEAERAERRQLEAREVAERDQDRIATAIRQQAEQLEANHAQGRSMLELLRDIASDFERIGDVAEENAERMADLAAQFKPNDRQPDTITIDALKEKMEVMGRESAEMEQKFKATIGKLMAQTEKLAQDRNRAAELVEENQRLRDAAEGFERELQEVREASQRTLDGARAKMNEAAERGDLAEERVVALEEELSQVNKHLEDARKREEGLKRQLEKQNKGKRDRR